MLSVMDDLLPCELAAAHELIRRLRCENDELRAKLSVYQENERREFERIYGKGATPQTLLNFGLLMAGKGGVCSSGNPNDPTVGELFARERAKRRRQGRERNERPRRRLGQSPEAPDTPDVST